MWTGECDVVDGLESTDQCSNTREKYVPESDSAIHILEIQ